MATKTERILANLPRTFRAHPTPTALHALAQAFGGELLRVENALAEIMQAHWVDHADRGAPAVGDLARMAALYGLAPRRAPLPEETAEEFRERLKSHVRTFLEGPSTLGGVLRVAADALGLRIDERLNGWWNRPGGDPAVTRPRGDDAAGPLFGGPARSRGRAATAARVAGPVLPLAGADLRAGSLLRISVDGGAVVEVDCAAGEVDRAHVPLSAIVAALEAALGRGVARDEDGRLALVSPTTGAPSSVEVVEGPGDAAPVLLGLPAREHQGRAGEDAEIAGTVDLPASLDLREHRYLRVTMDGARLAEVDCADPAQPGATPPAHVAGALNAALGPVARLEGTRLVLCSPTPGAAGSLAVREAAAQDAAAFLLGGAPREARGRDAAPAGLAGAAPLPGEIDLSTRFAVRVEVDGRRPVTVDCAGADPARTTPAEVAARLAAALAPGSARFDGSVLHASSPTAGEASTLAILPVTPEEDAGPLLFGLLPRRFTGQDAAAAVIHGSADVSAGVDLRARGVLAVAVDGAPAVEIDVAGAVARAGGDPARATAEQVKRAVNEGLGEWVAQVEGGRLVLASSTRGTAAAVEVVPLETTVRRPFTTRAFVVGEAASVLLGVPTAVASGRGATQARIEGTVDLRRGVDLRPARWIRVAVDGAPAVDVDCAKDLPRPRLALPGEVAAAINQQLFAGAGVAGVASVEAGRLVLTSHRRGAAAAVVLEPPRAEDARPALLGLEPGLWRGDNGHRVVFAGTAGVGAGVDLSTADRLRLKVDGQEHEVECRGADPAHTALAEIVDAINTAFANLVARSDGAHLVISSGGPGGSVEILPATGGPDAARLLLGIDPPRAYLGQAPAPARVTAARALAGPRDLRVARYLRLAVDGGEPAVVDCAATAADLGAVGLAEVADAIERVLGPGTAGVDAGRLVLTTRSRGSGARIELFAHSGADARAALFGTAPVAAAGEAPAPAVIEGTVDLSAGADLATSRTLRVAVDGVRPVDVEIAAVRPERAEPGEVLAALDRALPGLASITPDGKLRLASPTAGAASRLEVLPVRVIEIVEYPAEPAMQKPSIVRHGEHATLENDGADASDASVELFAPRGASSPALACPAAGTRIRYLGALGAGERLRLVRDSAAGVRAVVIDPAGAEHPVSPERLLAGTAGAQLQLPATDEAVLPRGRPGEPAALRLDDPAQPCVVALRARTPEGAHPLHVCAVEAALGPRPTLPPAGGQRVRLAGRVRVEAGRVTLGDADGAVLARLLPGASGGAERHGGRVVVVDGELHDEGGGTPVLLARRIDRLFDVGVREGVDGGREERFPAVTVGARDADDSLVRRVVAGAGPLPLGVAGPTVVPGVPSDGGTGRSRLVVAREEDKGALLRLPRGRSVWTYSECHGARFDDALFAGPLAGGGRVVTEFPGASCQERGIFDASRFARGAGDRSAAVFAGGAPDPAVELRVGWTRHRPGAFEVVLPAALPDYFGGRVEEGRLGGAAAQREAYPAVVTEPEEDPHHLLAALAASRLVTVKIVPRAPIGWTAIPVPLRRPRRQRLSGGREGRAARLYLADAEVPVVFELTASGPGAWGNAVEVGFGPWAPLGADGSFGAPVPGRFEVTVGFAGARMESARHAVAGGAHAPSAGADTVAPGPVGVLHARAAGVAARIIRERAEGPGPLQSSQDGSA